MRIQHNIAAMNSYRNFSANTSSLNKNLEKLSSGYKINRAGDDAAGLAISEKMRAQISGLEGATKNAKDGISLIQTAEGALTEVHDMLNRMTTLAEQSANGTYQDELDREQLQKEVDALKSEIDRIADSTNFNGLKLLDGGLTESTQAIEISGTVNSTENIDMTDGVTINAPVDGAGANQTYEMSFAAGTLFGAGDVLSFSATNTKTSAVTSSTMTYQASNTNSYDEFNGDTLEEQLTSMAKALNYADPAGTNNGAAYNAGYTARVEMGEDGSGKLILTANDAGQPQSTLRLTNVQDTQASSTKNTTTAGDNKTPTPLDEAGWTLLAGGTAGGKGDSFHVDAGDSLTFEFKVNGHTMYAKITEGEDFHIDGTETVDQATSKIVEALKAAKFINPSQGDQIVPAGTKSGASATTFNEIKANGAGSAEPDIASGNGPVETKTMDESAMTVGDFFTLKANTNTAGDENNGGQIQVTTKTGFGGYVGIGRVYMTDADSGNTTYIESTVTTQGAAGTGANVPVAEINQVDINNTTDQNMSVGEKFVVEGTLKDGRNFSIELSAVKAGTTDLGENEFAIGATQHDTAVNIANALKNADNVVKLLDVNGNALTDADGNELTLSAKDVFGGETGNDFTVSAGGSGTVITFTNKDSGAGAKGIAAKLTSAGIEPGDKITTSLQTVSEGKEQSKAQNVLTFKADDIEQGTTLEIDGKTYEFVTDDKFLTNENNVAVVVENLGNGAEDADVAGALKSVLEGDTADVYEAADGEEYKMAVSGGTLTITSKNEGEEVKALDVAMGANKATSIINLTTTDESTMEEEKYTANVKAGDTIKIGGRTYEFTAGSRTSVEGNIRVDLLDDDGETMTDANKIAQKLADVVNTEASTVSENNPALVARTDGTKVILTSKYNGKAAAGTDPYAAPDITLAAGTRKLKLQIGDTGEEYNQLSVEVKDMHATALGIGDVDVSTQAKATASLDKIKTAVNNVSDVRGTLGALQNRLDHTINNLGVMRENIQNAESSIRDTDVAEEMMAYTKNSILNQSAQAMLAQANQLPQGVLQLLG